MVCPADRLSSQDLLRKGVLETGLCTGCGACVGLCPYQVIYHERTVQLHRCDLANGKCRAFCPRSETDLSLLRNRLFDSRELTPEIGAVKGYYFSRATDARLQKIVQHGGTVTALLGHALDEGLIDSAIVSPGVRDFDRNSVRIQDKSGLSGKTGSNFTVSPTVAVFNRVAASEGDIDIGVVATPCQALALAKMKLKPLPEDTANIDKLKFVIGLYCGWTLAAEKFKALLMQNSIKPESLTGMDVPSGRKVLELRTVNGARCIPLNDIHPCIREACGYCFDSTAEYADVSVGSARFGDDWEEMRGWNQLIVRTQRGRELVEKAVSRGVLEIRQAPDQSLRELKKAAAEKKKTALRNIIGKSGSTRNLLYLRSSDPLVQKFLAKNNR